MSIEASSEMPELDVSGITVDDTIGNNNGAIDPGEPVRLTVQLAEPVAREPRSACPAPP